MSMFSSCELSSGGASPLILTDNHPVGAQTLETFVLVFSNPEWQYTSQELARLNVRFPRKSQYMTDSSADCRCDNSLASPFTCIKTQTYEHYLQIQPTMEILWKACSTSRISIGPTRVQTYRNSTLHTIPPDKQTSRLQTILSLRSRHGSPPTVPCPTLRLPAPIRREHSSSTQPTTARTRHLPWTIRCGHSTTGAHGSHRTNTQYTPCRDRQEPC